MEVNREYANGHYICVYENILSPGAIYLYMAIIHVYDHNIQTSSFKPLSQLKPLFMESIVWKKQRKFV